VGDCPRRSFPPREKGRHISKAILDKIVIASKEKNLLIVIRFSLPPSRFLELRFLL